MKQTFIVIAALALGSAAFSCNGRTNPEPVREIDYSEIRMGGELRQRIMRNFDRLEQVKYRPDSVFLTEEQSGYWPGDTEGRTILGLTLDAQATGRAPLYLDEIIGQLPLHLNELGYFGTVYPGKLNEQQLSGNGWMLRGLCEYYRWKGDESVLPIITSIAENLFVRGKGLYSKYPIDPSLRDTTIGEESGSIALTDGDWILSSDIGCVFIGMDGLIQAYEYLRSPEVNEVILEMIERFLEIDPVAIKAQTHATMTACRGLIRYAEITGRTEYIEEAARRFALYRECGMTENYENCNWFGRFDTWTEPCAIVDAFMVAAQLWKHTGDAAYRDDAELIYYNAIGHTQRHNGGFGCDNLPGMGSGEKHLRIHDNEAHWCCTMRGGEGLSAAARYSYFAEGGDTVWVPFFRTSEAAIELDGGTFAFSQESGYPFEGSVSFTVSADYPGAATIKIPVPEWTSDYTVTLNGRDVAVVPDNGFTAVAGPFAAGDVIEVAFSQAIAVSPVVNRENNAGNEIRVMYGPLVLGYEGAGEITIGCDDVIEQVGPCRFRIAGRGEYLTPVYHLMDSRVWTPTDYKKQILFTADGN